MNSFVNAAFGTDKLLTEDGNKWIYKNKEHGKNKKHFCMKDEEILNATLTLLVCSVNQGIFVIKKGYICFKKRSNAVLLNSRL